MSSINNNPSSLNLRQILAVVNEEMDKLSLVSADAGKVAGEIGDTGIKIAEEFKGTSDQIIQDTKEQLKVSTALTVVSAVFSAFAGIGTAAGFRAPNSSLSQGMASLGDTISKAAKWVAVPLTQAGSAIGTGVMEKKIGVDQEHQTKAGVTNNLLGTASSDVIATVDQAIKARTQVQTDLRGMVGQENEASLYQGG